jgi:hypothetical protein
LGFQPGEETGEVGLAPSHTTASLNELAHKNVISKMTMKLIIAAIDRIVS